MFRIVQKYFNNTQTELFTFPSPEEKILKVVIRRLPTVISDTELTEELVSKGYEVITVRQFVKAGIKLPLYMVSLPKNPASKSIFNEPSLFNIAVKVEAYKSTNPAQCFKCQRFGHSSIYCGFTPRCVTCFGSHLAKDCTKTLEQTPKFINCEGPHTANYKQCPEFAKQSSLPAFYLQRVPTTQVQPLVSNYGCSKLQYYAIAAKLQPAKLLQQSVDSTTIQMLTNLLSELTAGTVNIRDVLISTLTAFISLFLSHNV